MALSTEALGVAAEPTLEESEAFPGSLRVGSSFFGCSGLRACFGMDPGLWFGWIQDWFFSTCLVVSVNVDYFLGRICSKVVAGVQWILTQSFAADCAAGTLPSHFALVSDHLQAVSGCFCNLSPTVSTPDRTHLSAAPSCSGKEASLRFDTCLLRS